MLIHNQEGVLLQTLYFAYPILNWTVSEDEKTLMIGINSCLYCWYYDDKHKAYMLRWDDGDVFTCQGSILKDVIGISEANGRVFEQKGAKLINSNRKEEASITLSAESLSPEEILKTAGNLPELNQPLSEAEVNFLQKQIEITEQQKRQWKQQEELLKKRLLTHYQLVSKAYSSPPPKE